MALYHSAKGPLEYTIVGNPTIENGIASNFSSANHLLVPYTTDIGTADFEMKTAFTVNRGSAIYKFFGGTSSSVNSFTCIYWGRANIIGAGIIINNTFYRLTSSTKSVGVKYYVILYRKGTMCGLKISTDNVNFNEEYTRTVPEGNITIDGDGRTISIGSSGTTYALDGSIDLNETYVAVNGRPWFGLENVEVNKVMLNNTRVNYIVKDGKLVWADQGIYVQEPGSGSALDENTVALFHFDGTLKEEVSGITPSLIQSNPVYDTGEFGQSVASSTTNTALIINPTGIGTVSDATSYTIDFWMYIPDTASFPQGIRFRNDSNWAYGIGQITVTDSYYTVGAWLNGAVPMQMQFPTGFTKLNTWHHIAYVYDKSANKGYGFIDGQKVAEHTWTNQAATILYPAQRISYNCKIDEFRMSNVARWTSDFTPPTEPYGASTPGAKNYATQDMAPVPAGYTFGNTTTPSIGYVDIPTQVFTPAPEGAVIGRDE